MAPVVPPLVDLDGLVDPPPLTTSFDFFRRDFFGISGKFPADGDSEPPDGLPA